MVAEDSWFAALDIGSTAGIEVLIRWAKALTSLGTMGLSSGVTSRIGPVLPNFHGSGVEVFGFHVWELNWVGVFAALGRGAWSRARMLEWKSGLRPGSSSNGLIKKLKGSLSQRTHEEKKKKENFEHWLLILARSRYTTIIGTSTILKQDMMYPQKYWNAIINEN
jgi:hypothetical protein